MVNQTVWIVFNMQKHEGTQINKVFSSLNAAEKYANVLTGWQDQILGWPLWQYHHGKEFPAKRTSPYFSCEVRGGDTDLSNSAHEGIAIDEWPING